MGPSPKDIWDEGLTRVECLRKVREAQEAQRRAEEAQSKMQANLEEKAVARRKMAKDISIMQAQLAKLSKQKHGGSQQYLSDEEEHHSLNGEEDVHSSSSHHIPFSHVPDLHVNLNQRRVYNWDRHTSRNQKMILDEELNRDKTQKGTPKTVGRQEGQLPNQQFDEMQLVYLLSPMRSNPQVAEGYIISKDPHVAVGGDELGKSFYKVFVNKVLRRDERLIHAYGNLKVMGDVKGKHIAWPKQLMRRK